MTSTSACSSIVSHGKDKNTGPVGGVRASLNARRTAPGTSAGWWISWLHLVYWRVISTKSPDSVGSLSSIRVSELPAVSTTGVPPRWALYKALMPLASPPAIWMLANAGRPVARA